MRARMRETLMPQVQALFPQAHAHLVELALSFQRQDSASHPPVGSLFLAAGIKDRRNHWREVGKIIDTPSLNGPRGIDLPGSWRLIHEPKSRERPERWVLEKRD
jgi:hypothetical protein